MSVCMSTVQSCAEAAAGCESGRSTCHADSRARRWLSTWSWMRLRRCSRAEVDTAAAVAAAGGSRNVVNGCCFARRRATA
eukprot:COSAG03_NODE_1092_length_4831_cov_17.559594_5_plen_80_part_00